MVTFMTAFKRHERIDERKNVYKSKIFEPRLTLTSSYFTGHNIILGVEHTTDELTSDRFVNRRMTTRSLHETEYFLQDEWTVNSHWMLSSGVRTNFSKAFGFMWMPKIAIKYALDNHWALRANYSMGYRAPSIKELFSIGITWECFRLKEAKTFNLRRITISLWAQNIPKTDSLSM